MFSQRRKSRKKVSFCKSKDKREKDIPKKGDRFNFPFSFFSKHTHTQSFPFFSSFLIFLSHLSAAGKKRRRKRRGGKGLFSPSFSGSSWKI